MIKRKVINIKKISNAKTELKIKQQITVCQNKLDECVVLDIPIYYLDECMFTVRTHPTREYACKYQNVEIGASEYNIKATAFVGAIRVDHGLFYYELQPRAFKTDTFIEFLRNLRKAHGKGQFAIYQDNLRVHLSKLAKEAYEELDILTIFAPVYSPEYNPIEYCFSKLKGLVRKMRLNDMMNQVRRTYNQLVPIAAAQLTIDDVNHCIRHVHELYGLI